MRALRSISIRATFLAAGAQAGFSPALPAGAQEPPADACARGSSGERLGGVRGVVRMEDTPAVIADAEIRVVHVPTTAGPAPVIPTRIRADAAGRYELCRLPPGTTIVLESRLGERGLSRPARVWIPRDTVIVQDLLVPMGRAGRLLGRVSDRTDDAPIDGALVSVPALGIETSSGAGGGFALPPLPPGTYALSVSHLGFGTQVDSVSVLPEKSVVLELRVERRPIALEPLLVEVRAVRSMWLEGNGFYDRMQRESGAFITREEIERRRPARLSDLFSTIAGLRVDRGTVQMSRAPTSLVPGRGCTIQYFIDGRSVSLGIGLDAYMPDDIEAIEVYRGPSEMPPEFNEGRAACGAIVLWMRVARE